MKKVFLFLLGVLASIILPYVVEYFMPYNPGYVIRNNKANRDAEFVVRCDAGQNP